MTTPVSPVAGYSSPSAFAAQQAVATQTKTGTSSSSSSGLSLDPQAFLQLLVAQLQYQDPTNPTDTSQFMNQTAMLSQVQTMDSMGSTLQALASAQQAQSATALIGKQVTYLDANGMRVSGVATSANLLASGATLHIGDTDVPLSQIVAVAEPPTT